MKVATSLKMFSNAIKQIVGVIGVLLCCAMPAQAQAPKTFEQFDPPSDLVLTLPKDPTADGDIIQGVLNNIHIAVYIDGFTF